MKRNHILLSIGLFWLVTACSAVELDSTTTPHYSVEEVRADFAQLYETLQLAQYDLFANTPKHVFDKHYKVALNSLNKPMTEFELKKRFQQFVALADIAHTRIDFPYEEFSAFRESGGKTLPLYLSVREEGVFVNEFYGQQGAIQPFDQVLALNGKPIGNWLEKFGQHISADNQRIEKSLIEWRVPALLWLEDGEQPSYDVLVQKPSGKRISVTVPTITKEQQDKNASAQKDGETSHPNEREAKMLTDKIAYLRPGPFYNHKPGAENIWDATEFKRFIDQSFHRFIEAEAKALIIDLRENPGGTNSFSDHMLAWFASKPFKFASDFRVKVSPQSVASNDERLKLSTDANDVSHKLKAFYEKHSTGDVFSFELPVAQPRDGKQFTAPVYVLINRYSYSNAVSVAAMVQDYGFATVIGEKTADLATTYGAMEQFTLDNSGIVVGYPKAHIIRPNGDLKPDGVTPDVTIEMPLEKHSSERALQRVVDYIRTQI